MLEPRLRGAARRGKGISDSAAADLIASNAPLRGGTTKARQNGPKHYPRGFKGIAIPLARLSPLSFVVQRKMGPPEVVGLVERLVKNVQSKMGPPEVASCRTRPVKTQNKTIAPPEAVSQAERPREYHALQVNSLTGPQDFISTSTSAGPEALPLPSFLTMTVTIPLSPLPVPLWK